FGRDPLAFLLEDGCIPGALQARYQQLASSIIVQAEGLIDNLATLRLHGDFHVGNVLWNGPQCFILDFDDCISGPTVQDLWLICPGRDEYAAKDREIFIEAYQELRSFNLEDLQAVEALRSLRMI